MDRYVILFMFVCLSKNHTIIISICFFFTCEFNFYVYHIFCCNMFVFACPIIARSQCWLFALWEVGKYGANMRMCPHITYPYLPPNSTSGICTMVSKLYVKVQGNTVHKDMYKIAFQSN